MPNPFSKEIQMKRKLILTALLALPLAAAGFVYGHSRQANNAHKAGYTCPITGEELPCPKCCPLNKNK